MRQRRATRVGFMVRGTLAGIALAMWCGSAFGQAAAGTAMAPAATTGGNAANSTALAFSSTAGSGSGTGNPISKNNPFATYYSSPMTSGWGGQFQLKPQSATIDVSGGSSLAKLVVTGKGQFGTPAITTASTTTTGGGKAGGGGGGGTTATTGSGMAGQGGTSIGVRRTPAYYTTPGSTIGNIGTQPMVLQKQLYTALAETNMLPTGKQLNVAVQGDDGVVLLTGSVATEDERQLAANMLRLTPGVRFIRNEIEVVPPK